MEEHIHVHTLTSWGQKCLPSGLCQTSPLCTSSSGSSSVLYHVAFIRSLKMCFLEFCELSDNLWNLRRGHGHPQFVAKGDRSVTGTTFGIGIWNWGSLMELSSNLSRERKNSWQGAGAGSGREILWVCRKTRSFPLPGLYFKALGSTIFHSLQHFQLWITVLCYMRVTYD